MKHETLIALASAHAKLKAAADLVQWSLTAQLQDVLPSKEIETIASRLREFSSMAFSELVKHR